MADDDLIRRGDALAEVGVWLNEKYGLHSHVGQPIANLRHAIAALPAQGVRVRALEWEPLPKGGFHAFCSLIRDIYYADDADDAARQDATRVAAILAALEPAEQTVSTDKTGQDFWLVKNHVGPCGY
jgi:hypothetical protein